MISSLLLSAPRGGGRRCVQHYSTLRAFPSRGCRSSYSMITSPSPTSFAIKRHFSAGDPGSPSSFAIIKRHFCVGVPESTGSKSIPLAIKGAMGMCLFLLTISDPVISAFEKMGKDENKSYWMDQYRSQNNECEEENRLRNAHKHNTSNDKSKMGANDSGGNTHNLPDYSRVVIVGGGFAGLHTAVALAERMSNPSIQDANPPTQKSQIETNHNASKEIIVLDASQIGNGASGRAKGLVVPGFQVPLENLQENASDAEDDCSWTVPALVQSLSNTLGLNAPQPQYKKAVVEQMYDMTYVAMDRLRNIVKMYGIGCDWVDSGAIEGSIHPMEEEDEDDDEDDGCQILTSAQVNEIVGRPSDNLYKWGEYDPSCAGVNPLLLTIGLANAVEQWGVKVYEYTKVMKLEKKSTFSRHEESEQQLTQGKYTIVTDQGHTIHCDHVVLCTGAESLSDSVSQRLTSSFVPVYTWMASTEPLKEKCPLKNGVVDSVLLSGTGDVKHVDDNDESLDKEGRPAPMCGDDHISLNYWRNNNDKEEGRLLFGSLADTYILPKWMISWRLRNALTEIYPQLQNVKFDHIWGGKLAFALNSMPLIGRDTDYDDLKDDANADVSDKSFITEGGVWYATGFAGHGIVPTALAGSLLANAILGIPNEQQWQLFQTYFPPTSWNGYPFSRVGTGTVLLVYNTWDWLGKKGVPLPALPKLW